MKVLFLATWYPHRYDDMAGLFVRKHAEALVRQGMDVCVLYIHEDHAVKQIEMVEQKTHGIHEVYVYTPRNFLRALWQGCRLITSQWGLPDICQLNVISKIGLLADYLRLRYHIPYVIMEHWSAYLPENGATLHRRRLLFIRYIARHAACVMPVSETLAKAMKKSGVTNARWQVVPNVVDDFFYTPYERMKKPIMQFVHVSCFDNDAKNIMGILRAIQSLSLRRTDFHFTFIGTGRDFDAAVSYAEQLGIMPFLTFTGECPPLVVCEHMRQADAFVLFSNYETFAIVLAESIAMGMPFISTPVGCVHEIDMNTCGCLVPFRDEQALVQRMAYMIDHYADYDSDAIRLQGQCFSYDIVGNTLIQIYQQCLP